MMKHKQKQPYGCGLYAAANACNLDNFITDERLEKSKNGNVIGQLSKWMQDDGHQFYIDSLYYNHVGKKLPTSALYYKPVGEGLGFFINKKCFIFVLNLKTMSASIRKKISARHQKIIERNNNIRISFDKRLHKNPRWKYEALVDDVAKQYLPLSQRTIKGILNFEWEKNNGYI